MTPLTSSTEQIKQDILNVEEKFYEVMGGDEDALRSFYDRFQCVMEAALSHAEFDDELMMLVNTVSQRVAILAESMLSYHDSVKRISDQLFKELSSLDETQKVDELLNNNHTAFKRSPSAYIKPAYEWLLANLHNPYPSIVIRNHLAKESKCSRQVIDSWFTDIRKRIGWSALRKSFSNKRSAIVEAATRYFLHNGDGLSSDVRKGFAKMSWSARNLYSHKFLETSLASGLDSNPADNTDYPTPAQSPQGPSGTLPAYEDPREQPSLPKSPRAEFYLGFSYDHDNPCSAQAAMQETNQLPSPPASSDGELSQDDSHRFLSIGAISRKRKRSPSNSPDPLRATKRSIICHNASGKSSPLPQPTSLLDANQDNAIDDWFNLWTAQQPNTLDDLCAPVEVELFDYSSLNSLESSTTSNACSADRTGISTLYATHDWTAFGGQGFSCAPDDTTSIAPHESHGSSLPDLDWDWLLSCFPTDESHPNSTALQV
ncbi:hypothetical protein AX16_000508 [Volvariella volvacea WC 439]|uniref:Mating-type protein beta1-1 n=1 Tax=Volvariella volvacea TaxID=36659 RepID=H6VLD7_9AGAR|nr:mating-type protein beta1-1 [Volvariella volvacea]KAF8665493.1 hypothetical protein AX16_000508 [Volvariella volvacea WC 439]